MTERRFLEVELRVEGDEKPKIVGHAAVFDRVADIGWFREKIARGAFRQDLPGADVRALFNHDANFVLGRTPKTLRLSEDDKGLAIEIDPPDTQYASDLMVVIRRGDISQMSFAFETPPLSEEWDNGDPDSPMRTLKRLRLIDVSPVTFPAYEETDVSVRSREVSDKAARDSYERWQKSQRVETPRLLAARARVLS